MSIPYKKKEKEKKRERKRGQYYIFKNVRSYFMRKCRNNIQISSSHISSTDVIFTEVFDATLDIYSVYNMLF